MDCTHFNSGHWKVLPFKLTCKSAFSTSTVLKKACLGNVLVYFDANPSVFISTWHDWGRIPMRDLPNYVIVRSDSVMCDCFALSHVSLQ